MLISDVQQSNSVVHIYFLFHIFFHCSLSGFFKNTLFMYLFLAVLGLHCYEGFSLTVASRGYSLVRVCGLLTEVASLVAKHRL